jgi:hypothetical protein
VGIFIPYKIFNLTTFLWLKILKMPKKGVEVKINGDKTLLMSSMYDFVGDIHLVRAKLSSADWIS